MKYILKAYSIHELGQRDNQEDSIFPELDQVTSDDRLFILCDGMGGHDSGEVASAAVCDAMSQVILSQSSADGMFTEDVFQNALSAAYDLLDAKDTGAEKKMGTTMTFLKFHEGGAFVAHIGDSRVYQIRPATATEPAHIVFATRDHSLVNDLLKVGELTEEEAKNFPRKNVITRAMQPLQEYRSKAEIAHLTDIRPGDYFYMCSDGMLEVTDDNNLLFVVTKSDITDEEKKEMLIRLTKDNKDNHSAHLIHIIDTIGSIPAPVVKSAAEPIVAPAVESSSIRPAYSATTSTPAKKNNKNWLWILLFVVLLGVAAGGAWFLIGQTQDTKSDSNDNDKTERLDKDKDKKEHEPSKLNGAIENGPDEGMFEDALSNDEKEEIVGDMTGAGDAAKEEANPRRSNSGQTSARHEEQPQTSAKEDARQLEKERIKNQFDKITSTKTNESSDPKK